MPNFKPDEIRALRRDRDWTQPQLASHIGCHPQTVAWWEQGRRAPTGLYADHLDQLIHEKPPEDRWPETMGPDESDHD